MSWSRPLITQEEHAHLQRPIYLLSQWQRCFSVAALNQLNQRPALDFIFAAIFQAYHSLFFFYFSFSLEDFYSKLFKRETFDRIVFRKFLSALLKQGGSWHAGQTESISMAPSWGLISSMSSSLVLHLSDYVWGAAHNANASKPWELLGL